MEMEIAFLINGNSMSAWNPIYFPISLLIGIISSKVLNSNRKIKFFSKNKCEQLTIHILKYMELVKDNLSFVYWEMWKKEKKKNPPRNK